MVNDLQVRNLSPHTQHSYLLQVSQFARHFEKSSDLLGSEDIRAYLTYLMNEKKLAAKSVHVTVAALRFLYRITLGLDWKFDLVIPMPKAPKTLAVILSPEEVQYFLSCVESIKHRTILTTCYAAGLRISEATRLKPQAIDRQRMVLRVEQGKGQKDRYVMLSARLVEALVNYWRAVRPKIWMFPGSIDDRPITAGAVEGACSKALRISKLTKVG
jgi:site-specific recombinase XerD